MLLQYICNIIRFKKWRVLVYIGILIVTLKICSVVQRSSTNRLLELHKCPACYGTSGCDVIDKIDITPYDLFSAFAYLFGTKNVFYGILKDTKVVLKKLAHTTELEAFDQILCTRHNLTFPCAENLEKQMEEYRINYSELIKKELTIDFGNDEFSKLRLCPITDHLDELFFNVYHSIENTDLGNLQMNIWTLMSINPEPLVLQILPAEKEWPVPVYLGACGRIIIEEYVGPPLLAYYSESWLRRAKIAHSLLNAAYIFTFKNPHFSFYLTDVSADNIAVDSQDVAKFIDLENVIVVDKNISEKERTEHWSELYRIDFDCSNCFSPIDICSHELSDHNYYAICQVLIFEDFLHDIPPEIGKQYPNLEYQLNACAASRTHDKVKSRIDSGEYVKTLLNDIIKQ